MPLEVAGQVGPQTLTDGASQALRQGRTGALVVTELHGRYFEQNFRRNIYTAVNAASTSSAGLATTYTGGVCVSNPIGSLVNLGILKVSVSLVVISAAVTVVGLAGGFASTGIVTHTTPLTPFSNLVGAGNKPSGMADQAATLVGTPTWLYPGIASTGIAAGVFGLTLDLEGSIIVPPGGYVCTATNIASPASGFLGSITWEEVAI